MKIAVLNGSPRMSGNTSYLVAAFKEGAESKGHVVDTIWVGGLQIAGCHACEYCHTKENGVCCIRDNMDDVWKVLDGADMIVLASSVHYWGFTGPMESAISRFYCKGKPEGVAKYMLLLSSGSPDVYRGIEAQYKEIVGYFGAEDCGIFEFNGTDAEQRTAEAYNRAFAIGADL